MDTEDDFEWTEEMRQEILAFVGTEMLTVWVPLGRKIHDDDVEWAKRFGERLNRDLKHCRGGFSSIDTELRSVGIGISGQDAHVMLELITPTLKRHCPLGTYIFMEDLASKWPSKNVNLFEDGELAPMEPLEEQ